jgi:hypothetical protein
VGRLLFRIEQRVILTERKAGKSGARWPGFNGFPSGADGGGAAGLEDRFSGCLRE